MKNAVPTTTAFTPTSMLRGPSDAEMLKSNPFRNYDPSRIRLGPETLPPLPPSRSTATKSKTKLAAGKTARRAVAQAEKKERVASPLNEVYPVSAEDGTTTLGEFSFEEILASRLGLSCAPLVEWQEKALETGEAFAVDKRGEAILFDAQGQPMFTYLRDRLGARLFSPVSLLFEIDRLTGEENTGAEEERQQCEEEGARRRAEARQPEEEARLKGVS